MSIINISCIQQAYHKGDFRFILDADIVSLYRSLKSVPNSNISEMHKLIEMYLIAFINDVSIIHSTTTTAKKDDERLKDYKIQLNSHWIWVYENCFNGQLSLIPSSIFLLHIHAKVAINERNTTLKEQIIQYLNFKMANGRIMPYDSTTEIFFFELLFSDMYYNKAVAFIMNQRYLNDQMQSFLLKHAKEICLDETLGRSSISLESKDVKKDIASKVKLMLSYFSYIKNKITFKTYAKILLLVLMVVGLYMYRLIRQKYLKNTVNDVVL